MPISNSLALLIKKTRKDKWKGFWERLAFDGDFVACEATVGRDSYSFTGLNGCPPGFASILMKINSVSGREIFSSHWESNEAGSEYKENHPLGAVQIPTKRASAMSR